MIKNSPKELAEYSDGLCLSLVIPTVRYRSLRLFNIRKIRQAMERARARMMAEGYSPVEVETLLLKLYELDAGLAGRKLGKGVGFYVSKDVGEVVLFPFEVGEKIRTGTHFEKAELAALMRFQATYFVVQLYSNEIHLFRGGDMALEEVHDHEFPMKLEKPSVSKTGTPGTKAAQRGILALYEEAGRILLQYINPDAPMIVCGSNDEIAAFRSVTNCEYFIAATRKGHFRRKPGPDLCKEFTVEAYRYRSKSLPSSKTWRQD
ncbi:MAG: hypothetical protein JST46_05295 [Bacteroidetes bacterium]|nr:hypothetical protein [Bacteroidota bacterium]